jgi:hypothetical protein
MTMPAPRTAIVTQLALDFALPVAVYYGLRASGVDQWWSLLLSAVVPVAVVVFRFIQRRQVEYVALFVISIVALSLVVSALTGNPRTMLVREAWAGLLAGLIGLWLIGSCVWGRPAPFVIMRSFVLAKVGPAGLQAWESRWDSDAAFRRSMRIITLVWGCAGLLNVVAQLLEAYGLPLDLAPGVMNATWPVIVVPVALFHLYYTKHANLRA